VSHSALVYVFDRSGGARLLISGMATATPDLAGTAADLRRLAAETGPPGFWERLAALV
jgi:protein SCO1/2